jgi:TonB family protein
MSRQGDSRGETLMKNSTFVVKVTAGGAVASKTWNTESDLALGHPIRWVLERSEKGIQIRNLSDDSVRQLSESQLEKEIELHSGYKVALKEIDALPPAYETHGSDPASYDVKELRIYGTRGLWTTSDDVVGASFTARVEGKRAFTVDRESASKYLVRSHAEGVRVGDKLLGEGKSASFEVKALAGHEISLGEFKWKFELLKSVAAPVMDVVADADEAAFKRTLKQSMVFIAICALISLIVPKPEAPVAPQATRFVFKKLVKGYMTSAAKGDPSARDFSQGANKSVSKPRGSDKPTAGQKVQKARKGKETSVAKASPKKSSPAQPKAQPKAVAKASAPKAAAKKVVKAAPAPKAKARPVVAQSAPKAAPIAPRGKVLPSASRAAVARAKPQQNDLANSAIGKLLGSTSLRNAADGAARGGVSRMKVGAGSEAGEMGELARGRSAMDDTAGVAGGNGVGARRVEVSGTGGGSGFRGGEGVGYGRGSHAAVNGQGKSFVSLDTSASDVAEGLTKDQVGRVIHKHMSEIRYCYESAMIREPDVEGKLAVNFVIGGGGQVKRAGVAQSSLGDAKLDNCVMERLVRWKFPTPKGGVDVAVNYPFVFKTLGK